MRFRLGLILGLAIGYVLGAKAGRQRYEQIRSASARVSRSQPAQQIGAEVRDVAARAGGRIEHAAADQVAKVTTIVRGEDSVTHDPRSGTLPPA